MPEETITIETADGPMPAFISEPDGPSKGSIVVIQEAFGLTDYLKDVCERLSKGGWQTIAPSLYHREGSPVIPENDLPSTKPHVEKLTADSITMDLNATFDELEERGVVDSNIGVVGFCMGGSVAFYATTLRPIGAAVTFYGSRLVDGRFGFPPLEQLTSLVKAPWLGLYGDLDPSIPVDQVEQIRKSLSTGTHYDTEIVRYPNADHAFHNDRRADTYHQDSAKDAWQRALHWFDRHIG